MILLHCQEKENDLRFEVTASGLNNYKESHMLQRFQSLQERFEESFGDKVCLLLQDNSSDSLKIILKIRLEKLGIKHQNLTAEAAALREENTNLKRERQKLGAELAGNQNALKKINSDFDSLKADSAEFLKLKTKYDAVAAELAEKSQKLETLEEDLSTLTFFYYFKWFLGGSAVLLVCFMIWFSTKRQRRRPSLL